jgi:flagellar basal-body rod protein FlgF
MSDGIYSALSGALAQERSLQATANNVANANTDGYKADKAVFAEYLKKEKQAHLPEHPELRYAGVDELWVDHTIGSIKFTGRKLDTALHGDGWFTVSTPQGERYTRAGSFVMDRAGILRTPDGHEVLGELNNDISQPGHRIQVPKDTREVQIAMDGTVSAVMPDLVGNNNNQILGKLKLVRFEDQRKVEREGLNLFKTKDGALPQRVDDLTTVEQGYLEISNVNAVHGMNELVVVSRYFDALEKVIETFRDIDGRTARDVGGRV